VISPTSLHVVVVAVVAHLADINLAAEVMVVDTTLMVEAVMVAEHPTLDEPIHIHGIQMLYVMDVDKITMSWPVQPLQPNENVPF
jgi:hypothetical protein